MLLIYNYESQVMKRQKKGGTRTQYDLETARIIMLFMIKAVVPDLDPFVVAVTRMINSDLVAEVTL